MNDRSAACAPLRRGPMRAGSVPAGSVRGGVRTALVDQAWVAQEGPLQFRQMNVDFPRRACGGCQVSGDQGLLDFGAQVAANILLPDAGGTARPG
jgi:hypothetical protein